MAFLFTTIYIQFYFTVMIQINIIKNLVIFIGLQTLESFIPTKKRLLIQTAIHYPNLWWMVVYWEAPHRHYVQISNSQQTQQIALRFDLLSKIVCDLLAKLSKKWKKVLKNLLRYMYQCLNLFWVCQPPCVLFVFSYLYHVPNIHILILFHSASILLLFISSFVIGHDL